MISKIKVGDIVTDDLTRTKAKVIEVLEPGPRDMLPGYRIDNDWLDGYRQAWEIWTDEQLKELEEELKKEPVISTQNRTTYNHHGKPEEYPDGYIPPFMCVLQDDKDYQAGWYFFDECGEAHGPFSTFEETRELLSKYEP
jgi:hypothetical protein